VKSSLIVAMATNGVIGINGDLPWKLSADLRRFKQLTMGHAIIMGRKTYDSLATRLGGGLLPGRTSIVVTRQDAYPLAAGALRANNLEAAIALARDDSEVFIIGGAEIYRAAMPLVDRMYVTVVNANIDGDTHFPEWDRTEWQLVEENAHLADERNAFDYAFRVYDRSANITT